MTSALGESILPLIATVVPRASEFLLAVTSVSSCGLPRTLSPLQQVALQPPSVQSGSQASSLSLPPAPRLPGTSPRARRSPSSRQTSTGPGLVPHPLSPAEARHRYPTRREASREPRPKAPNSRKRGRCCRSVVAEAATPEGEGMRRASGWALAGPTEQSLCLLH